MKRINCPTWNNYFIDVACLISQRSKDPDHQVGTVIVNPLNNTIISTGYNGMPRGCSDDIFPWVRNNNTSNWLDTKYPYVVHAEANAIINAQQNCQGFTIYTTLFPCNECAKLIIQAGIKLVYYIENLLENEKWRQSFEASKRMFDNAKISYKQVKKLT